ncbi:hypothetical protein BN1723_009104 [Verticillium longisporum]|uniref:AAA+ ATPase domain-containing protein n=1 Tax=Verticillium longisporum TaxID=100787 RepID=A0A0G4KLQ9_VERLO|nr:hypothetical protein BN1723_009104 [Verticillium longisporum]
MDSHKNSLKNDASTLVHTQSPTADVVDDSDSGDSRSTASRRSSDSDGQNTLFISSTISRYDTLSESYKKQDMLSKIGSRFEKEDGGLSLRASLKNPSKSDEHRLSVPKAPSKTSAASLRQSVPPPSGQGPLSRPDPYSFQPVRPFQRPGAARPKVWNNANWRQILMKKRGLLPGANSASASSQSLTRNGGEDGDESKAKSVSTASTAPETSTSKGEASDTLGLAESLTEVMEKHLDLDVMDQSRETSRFIAYLLDTIQLLQTKLSYARAPEPDDTLDRSDLLDDTITQPHSHSGFIFEDEPKTLTDVNTGIMLSGKAKIANLESYLVKRPDICLVVFKRHDCISSEKTLKTDKASKLNERDEWLKVTSPMLVKALKQVAEFQCLKGQKPTQGRSMNGDYGQDYEEADELLTHGYITAKHITKLYKPNHMVLSRQARGALEAYVLGKFPEIDKDAMAFQGWSWQYDGTELSRKEWSDTMNRVAEEERIAIADLSIHPIEFARGSDIETLDTRGRQFWDLRKQVYKCYTGWDKSRSNNYVDARFMVDVSSYQLMHRAGTSHPRYDRDLSPFDKWPTRIDRSEENLPPSTIMLLPATIYGFSFQEKKWVNLNVENFFPVNWNKKAFERLVLDPKTKEMIYALVDVQSSAEKMDDIIKGKGNGLIVLLHGSPGTGKTLTTESVAEIAEKPLYRVTCGDIGTDAKEVEDYLQTVLHLGKIWDCVLLLDEADVFLEERTMADLQRNSLVTVFLRVLEYYEGILMLTSNRVGTFDEAFKSRIQVAIHYDNLSKKARKAIWRNFFDMIEDSPHEDVNMPELERRLDELAAEEMNGRQIRNALRTARQLAKHRNERLDWPHLSQVIKTSGAFNKYLKAVRGHSDDQWAREEMIR